MERNYDYDVSSYISVWYRVHLVHGGPVVAPQLCGTAPTCREAKSEGDVRADPVRDPPTGLGRTQVYLAPFDAVRHVPASRPSTIDFAQMCSTNMS